MFWGLMLFYTHLLLLLQTSVLWLSIVTFNNDAKPPPKWILREFSLGGLPHLETFTWQIWPPLRRLPGLADRATYLSWSPHLSCKRDHIKMRDYVDRRVTPPKLVTSPTWGTPPPCKQTLWKYNYEQTFPLRYIPSESSLGVINPHGLFTQRPWGREEKLF